MTERSVKCVVVGDGAVGKTCLILRYALGDISSLGLYVPTVADTYALKLMAGETPVIFNLWDTAGTNIFLVCFAVDSNDSFANARDLWIPEVRHFCPGAEILLVGTKGDTRNNPLSTQSVSTARGTQLAKKMKAAGYVECSALTGDGIKTVFDTAIRITLKPNQSTRKRTCQYL